MSKKLSLFILLALVTGCTVSTSSENVSSQEVSTESISETTSTFESTSVLENYDLSFNVSIPNVLSEEVSLYIHGWNNQSLNVFVKLEKDDGLSYHKTLANIPSGVFQYEYALSVTGEFNPEYGELGAVRELNVSSSQSIQDTVTGFKNTPAVTYSISFTVTLNKYIPDDFTVYLVGNFPNANWGSGYSEYAFTFTYPALVATKVISLPAGSYEYSYNVSNNNLLAIGNLENRSNRTLDVTNDSTIFDAIEGWTNPLISTTIISTSITVHTDPLADYLHVYLIGNITDSVSPSLGSHIELTPNLERDTWSKVINTSEGYYSYQYLLDDGSKEFNQEYKEITLRNAEIFGTSVVIEDTVGSWNAIPIDPATTYLVTFNLNATNIPLWTDVYISGTLSEPSWSQIPLTPNGDRTVFSTTLSLTKGGYSYKYTLGSSYYEAGDNRYVVVSNEAEVNDHDVTFEAVPPNPDTLPVQVTFNVTVPSIPVWANVYIVGTIQTPDTWVAADANYKLVPNDLRTVWSIDLDLLPSTYSYKYVLGTDSVPGVGYWEDIPNNRTAVIEESIIVNDVVDGWNGFPPNPDYVWYIVGEGSFVNGSNWEASSGIRFDINSSYTGDGVEYMKVGQAFAVGDIFKFTDGQGLWAEEWETSAGSAFADGNMHIENGNAVVDVAGSYSIYLKVFSNGTTSCWVS